jgi:hypothetical protein
VLEPTVRYQSTLIPIRVILHRRGSVNRSVVNIPTVTNRIMPTTFTLFPDLPTELRRKIWAVAIDHPRLIHPQLPPADSPSEPPKHYYRCKPPILLQICKESRIEALLRYHPVSLPGGSYLGPPLYLNPSLDILYLSHDTSTPPHHGVMGEFSLFTPISVLRPPGSPPRGAQPGGSQWMAPPPSSPWDDLRTIALCSSGAQRLVEPLCVRFPKLDRVFLVQSPERMQDAHLVKKRMESHLDRRREARGDAGIPEGLVIEVVSWDGLRRAVGEWDPEGQGEESVLQCKTCLLRM